jgi:hypothetical protein
MWKNGGKKTVSTLFPHRKKTQNVIFHSFSTLHNRNSTQFSTRCWKTMWKKLQSREAARIVSIGKISKKIV